MKGEHMFQTKTQGRGWRGGGWEKISGNVNFKTTDDLRKRTTRHGIKKFRAVSNRNSRTDNPEFVIHIYC